MKIKEEGGVRVDPIVEFILTFELRILWGMRSSRQTISTSMLISGYVNEGEVELLEYYK
jgi:hypothetical protein